MSQMPAALAKYGKPITVHRTPAGLVLTPSAPFVTGNSIAVKVNGTAIAPVAFAVDHATTLQALAVAIAAVPGVTSATVLGAAVVVQNPRSVSLTEFIVTGGASQPTATLTGGWVAGRWVPGTSIAFETLAIVTPKSLRSMEREQLLLPEGAKTRGTILVVTSVPLQTLGEAQAQEADVITWRGVDYKVEGTTPWDDGPLPHYEALAAKVEEQS